MWGIDSVNADVGFCFVCAGDGKNLGTSCFDFVDIALHFCVESVGCTDCNNLCARLYERDSAVLHFTRRIGFGMNIADFFELE